jgi:hypothetical protein
MQNRPSIAYILVFLSLFACNEFDTDSKDLNGRYYFQNKGVNGGTIHFHNAASKNIIYADVVDYALDDSFILAEQHPSRSYIKNYLGNDLYDRYTAYADYLRNPHAKNQDQDPTVLKSIQGDSINYREFLERGADDKNSIDDINIYEQLSDSLINNDPYYKRILSAKQNFWIIRLSDDSMFGPLTKSVYFKERARLSIPRKLMLSFEK